MKLDDQGQRHRQTGRDNRVGSPGRRRPHLIQRPQPLLCDGAILCEHPYKGHSLLVGSQGRPRPPQAQPGVSASPCREASAQPGWGSQLSGLWGCWRGYRLEPNLDRPGLITHAHTHSHTASEQESSAATGMGKLDGHNKSRI